LTDLTLAVMVFLAPYFMKASFPSFRYPGFYPMARLRSLTALA